MLNVAELFFKDEECLMQLRPPKSEYVNVHDFVLHWWRPQTAEEEAACRAAWIASGEPLPWADEIEIPGPIPRPPVNMV